jgi:hypothetical protein
VGFTLSPLACWLEICIIYNYTIFSKTFSLVLKYLIVPDTAKFATSLYLLFSCIYCWQYSMFTSSTGCSFASFKIAITSCFGFFLFDFTEMDTVFVTKINKTQNWQRTGLRTSYWECIWLTNAALHRVPTADCYEVHMWLETGGDIVLDTRTNNIMETVMLKSGKCWIGSWYIQVHCICHFLTCLRSCKIRNTNVAYVQNAYIKVCILWVMMLCSLVGGAPQSELLSSWRHQISQSNELIQQGMLKYRCKIAYK